MKDTLKKDIITAAKAYMETNKLSASQLATLADINDAYLSTMLAGKTKIGTTDISDRWYHMLAATVGIETRKKYWAIVPTIQFKEAIAELTECKNTCKPGFIIAETGSGKTYAIDAFVQANPLHTYRITVNSLYNLGDIINDLCDLLNIEAAAVQGRLQAVPRKSRLDKIRRKLYDIRDGGGLPIIIIDESENMKSPALRLMKSLYDWVSDVCSIVMIGTDDLDRKLQPSTGRKSFGMPQLHSRFRAYRKVLTPLNKNYKAFFEKFGIKETAFRDLLTSMAPTYRELRDYLLPAMKEADEQGKVLNEEFFRLKYNLPARKA